MERGKLGFLGPITCAAAAFLLSACTYETPEMNKSPSANTAPSSQRPELVPASASWGPDARYFSNNGLPYGGGETWPGPAKVTSFTEVSTGLVYVDAETLDIVWVGWNRENKVIGRQPWREPGATRIGRYWGEFRDMVGNPSHDVVAWVETVADQRGDVVVVQASTGRVLARAPLDPAAERIVLFGSVDDKTISYSTLAEMLNLDAAGVVWTWNWAAGEIPRRAMNSEDVVDVSGETWAVNEQSQLTFRRPDGAVMSAGSSSYGDRTYFGGGLSPGGKYWYAPAHDAVVETATGREIPLERGFEQRYGWTGPEELTLVGPGLAVCSAVTGQCQDPIRAPFTDAGFALPLN